MTIDRKEKEMEISAGEFKARCLKLMDDVARTHQPLIITKRGRPIARMVPLEDREPVGLFGYMAGTATLHGDIVAPLDVAWEAMDEVQESAK
jgi:prevent-host-death family protein